jgi:hypothetical protein
MSAFPCGISPGEWRVPPPPAGPPVRCPVGVHERGGHVVLQLDDGEAQRGDGQHLRAVDGAVPLEIPRWSHAELMGQVTPLVMVLGETNGGGSG